LNEIFKLLKLSPTLILLFIVIYFILNPEKVQIWSSILCGLFSAISDRASRRSVKNDIEGRVNYYVKILNKNLPSVKPVGLNITWVSPDEKEEQFFDENKLVLRIRKHPNQNKNFVNASMMYVSKVILKKLKRYLSQTQKDSIDFFVEKSLLEKVKKNALDYFMSDLLMPALEANSKMSELFDKYNIIDKTGLFYPVFLQEMEYLGNKVFYSSKKIRPKIIKEVKEFISFLKNYSDREIGQEDTMQNFEKDYLHCAIMIVAKRQKIGADIKPYVRYIKNLVDRNMENIYIIGPAKKANIQYMKEIIDYAAEKFKYSMCFEGQYSSAILFHGSRTQVSTYLMLLRKIDVQKYYDEEYIKSIQNR